ncbi:MAG TPA: DNA polymerase III subunit gamma/tau, partial [Nocardioides sp.]|nr:DNA polymerase III subunit gamma/tau [Nocardioides sp.]
LVPPKVLGDYMASLCESEGVAIEPAALPLVVRAGAGSARDSLSVLDQLLGGAGPGGVTHKLATDLLGFTPDSLLDEVVEAFASRDGAAVFSVVDKVVETGQDPRRFTEDLLRRLRDLVIVTAVPDAPATGLIDVPQDAGERLVAQAARFGAIELSRAADIVAAGLTEMRGATAPRLLLELLCARVLLPGADHTSEGVMARLERLERRLDVTGTPAPASPVAAAAAAAAPPAAAPAPAAPVETPPHAAQDAPAPAAPARDEPVPLPPVPTSSAHDGPPPPPPMPSAAPAPSQAPAPAQQQPAAVAPDEPVAEQADGPQGGLSLVDVRRLWPDILEQTKNRRRLAWMVLSQHAHVVDVDAKRLTVGFANSGARDSFVNGGCDEILRQAAIDVVGMDWRVESIVDPSGAAAQAPVVRQSATDAPSGPGGVQAASQPPTPAAQPGSPAPGQPAPDAPDGPPSWVTGEGAQAAPAAAPEPASAPVSAAPAREALQAARNGGIAEPVEPIRSADDDVDRDDPDAESGALDTESLLSQALGARLIEEIKND